MTESTHTRLATELEKQIRDDLDEVATAVRRLFPEAKAFEHNGRMCLDLCAKPEEFASAKVEEALVRMTVTDWMLLAQIDDCGILEMPHGRLRVLRECGCIICNPGSDAFYLTPFGHKVLACRPEGTHNWFSPQALDGCVEVNRDAWHTPIPLKFRTMHGDHSMHGEHSHLITVVAKHTELHEKLKLRYTLVEFDDDMIPMLDLIKTE